MNPEVSHILDVKPIRANPGARREFAFSLDLSALTFLGERLLPEPVPVEGFLLNHAGMLELHAQALPVAQTFCARCAKPLRVTVPVAVDQPLSDEVQDEENDDIVRICGDAVDAGDILTQAVILALDMVYLCDPDCRGLCPGCGADLNAGPCFCGYREDGAAVPDGAIRT